MNANHKSTTASSWCKASQSWFLKATTQYDQQWWIVTAIDGHRRCVYRVAGSDPGLHLSASSWLDYAAPAGFSADSYSVLTLSEPAVISMLLFRIHGLYDRDNLLGGITEYRFMTRAVFDGIIFIILTSFILRDSFVDISRGWLLSASVSSPSMLMLIERFVLRQIFNRLRRSGWLMARAIIVGANDQGVAMADLWRKDQGPRHERARLPG